MHAAVTARGKRRRQRAAGDRRAIWLWRRRGADLGCARRPVRAYVDLRVRGGAARGVRRIGDAARRGAQNIHEASTESGRVGAVAEPSASLAFARAASGQGDARGVSSAAAPATSERRRQDAAGSTRSSAMPRPRRRRRPRLLGGSPRPPASPTRLDRRRRRRPQTDAASPPPAVVRRDAAGAARPQVRAGVHARRRAHRPRRRQPHAALAAHVAATRRAPSRPVPPPPSGPPLRDARARAAAVRDARCTSPPGVHRDAVAAPKIPPRRPPPPPRRRRCLRDAAAARRRGTSTRVIDADVPTTPAEPPTSWRSPCAAAGEARGAGDARRVEVHAPQRRRLPSPRGRAAARRRRSVAAASPCRRRARHRLYSRRFRSRRAAFAPRAAADQSACGGGRRRRSPPPPSPPTPMPPPMPPALRTVPVRLAPSLRVRLPERGDLRPRGRADGVRDRARRLRVALTTALTAMQSNPNGWNTVLQPTVTAESARTVTNSTIHETTWKVAGDATALAIRTVHVRGRAPCGGAR